MGSKYLRQCETVAYAQEILRAALILHGTTKIGFEDLTCDYDGNFGSIIIVEKEV